MVGDLIRPTDGLEEIDAGEGLSYVIDRKYQVVYHLVSHGTYEAMYVAPFSAISNWRKLASQEPKWTGSTRWREVNL